MQSSGMSGGMGMDVDVDADLDIDEQERQRRHELEIEQHRIWGEKVLLLIVITTWLVAMTASYLDGGTGASALLVKILTGVYEFMLSYISFSQRAICDIISFVIGIVFMVLLSMSSIIIIVLLSIPFLALIFTFTNI